jgi:hypothetical protein
MGESFSWGYQDKVGKAEEPKVKEEGKELVEL